MPIWVARIIIIVGVLVLLLLLRKFVKRLIFIIVLLGLAFFIYGLFSPSGAARLWYGVKTFPQQVAAFFGGEVVVPYVERQQPEVEVSSVKEKTVLPSLNEEVVTSSLDAARSFSSPQRRTAGIETFSRGVYEKIAAMPAVEESLPAEPEEEQVPVAAPVVSAIPVGSPEPAPVVSTLSSSSSSSSSSTKINTSSKVSSMPSGLSAQDIRDAEELWGMLSSRQ
ncbi:MAG: hypothetical protein LBU27_09570 [Candidatus Peribacteria bacterium]|jgi:hypothetical protein|nr:hypothetical protein [Candidatus Peribacteria bacterium]